MRRPASLLLAVLFLAGLFMGSAWAQEDKKTDDLKPADPDTGESSVEETTARFQPSSNRLDLDQEHLIDASPFQRQ